MLFCQLPLARQVFLVPRKPMPVGQLVGMVSRPVADREPYFPCEEGCPFRGYLHGVEMALEFGFWKRCIPVAGS